MTAQAQLSVRKIDRNGFRYAAAEIDELIIAGWTGRDQAAMEKHIRELEDIGVPRPKTTPIFYRVAASLLTTNETIQVSGPHSSGEVEFVLHRHDDGLWVGVGSDHTDRKAETLGISLAKQLCGKATGPDLWRYDEVRPHWERLRLRAHAWIGGERQLYQDGPVTAMRDPEDLMGRYGALKPGTVMYCGTLAAQGGIRPAEAFEMELEDPVLKRSIRHRYRIVALPVHG